MRTELEITCGVCESEYRIVLTAKYMKPSDIEFCCCCGEPLTTEEEESNESDGAEPSV